LKAALLKLHIHKSQTTGPTKARQLFFVPKFRTFFSATFFLSSRKKIFSTKKIFLKRRFQNFKFPRI
jgi:hypothetical protein